MLTTNARARALGLTPRARIVDQCLVGVDPVLMLTGPIDASHRMLDRTGLSMGDFDTIEINEAFAAQVLAVTRGLGLADDAAHVNRNGGAIALGQPLGASGARLVLTAMHGLEPGRGRALVSMCVGVGQGVALALEAVR